MSSAPQPEPGQPAKASLLDRALLGEEDATALGLCRALVVGVLTLSLLSHVGAVADYFSSDAVLFGRYARQAFPTRFSIFFYIEDPLAVQSIFAAGVVAHLMWMVGLFTVPAGLFSLLIWVSLVGRNPLLYSLPDQLQMAICLIMALVPAGRGFSLDAHWRGRGKPVPVWCRRIIQLQIGVMYVDTGILKSGKTWWGDGTALYYALVNPYNRHFDIAHILAWLQPWLLRPITWMVLAWEIVFGAFVALHWVREISTRARRLPDPRWMFLGFGVLMHVGIQVMLYVVWFTPLTIACYAAFLRPDEARRLIGWTSHRVARITGRR